MKRLTLALLYILPLLAACAAPQISANTPISSTSIPLVTVTPILPTDIPVATASPQQPGILNLVRFNMIDANSGWGEGYLSEDGQITANSSYHLLRTTDGGATWEDVTPPTWFDSPRLASITLFAIDVDTAWAIPPGFPFSEDPPYIVVWRTTDGGKSWKPSNPIYISASPLRDASPQPQFVDEQHGWLTLHFEHRVNAYNLEYRTTDGGVTWEQTGMCSTFDGDIIGRCTVPEFTDARTGWRMSLPQYNSSRAKDPASNWWIQRTLDGGQTWQTITLPHSQEEKECNPWPTRVATGIVGIYVDCITPADTQESYYYLSGDRGQTWQIFPQPEGTNVFFLDMTTGWRESESANGHQLERTTDGGKTWQQQADSLFGAGFQFVDADHGWASVYADPDLRRTTDGGKTWQSFTPRFLPPELDKPALARLESGSPLVLQSIQMIGSLNGWAVGANGYVFHTMDGGHTWQDVTPLHGHIVPRRELFALNEQRAWTTVSFPASETIWSTSDGGQSWKQMVALSEGQAVSPGSIRFLTEDIGWFQSSQGGNTREVHLLQTQDQGVTWEVQSTGQYSYYAKERMGFLFLDEQHGFRIEPVGDHTLGEFLNDNPILISKTTDRGQTWQPVDLPNMSLDIDDISLNQKAYPGGIQELRQEILSCEEGIRLRAFSADTIGLRLICRGGYREVYGTYGYVFVLSGYYLSADAGASWNNWVTVAEDVPRENDETPVESEFFLPGGIGWRLKANQILHTTDGGKTWSTLKAVGWEQARLDFINPQEGWAIAKSGDAISLVHTTDGGKTWEEIRPVVENR